ncbi:MAG: sce7726 family protein [Candidatus Moranbacteria bacterium]|jgi:hypothetical protein|nr:sce7726 family protein [Candidatus Moranbacteria bacterium]
MRKQHFILTNDDTIRVALRKKLEMECGQHISTETKIIEELGIIHGTARIDIAVVNGVIHGYELKSDKDTLKRLPGQIEIYNAVLDRVTLVVGRSHLHEAIKIIPEWWGVTVAKANCSDKDISFYNIREPETNPDQNRAVAMAALLWRDEAIAILEKIGKVDGFRSKPRMIVYKRLAEVLEMGVLSGIVRDQLRSRLNWRSELQCIRGGD